MPKIDVLSLFMVLLKILKKCHILSVCDSKIKVRTAKCVDGTNSQDAKFPDVIKWRCFLIFFRDYIL